MCVGGVASTGVAVFCGAGPVASDPSSTRPPDDVGVAGVATGVPGTAWEEEVDGGRGGSPRAVRCLSSVSLRTTSFCRSTIAAKEPSSSFGAIACTKSHSADATINMHSMDHNKQYLYHNHNKLYPHQCKD